MPIFKNSTLISLFFLLLFCYFLAVNLNVPLSRDDYWMTITSPHFSSILQATSHLYKNWSGSFAFMFVGYFMFWKVWPGRYLGDFLNATSLTALIYVCFLFAYQRKPTQTKDLVNLIFIFALVWFTTSTLGEVCFSKTGGMSYLWPIMLNLFFIYPYYQLLFQKPSLSNAVYWKWVYGFTGFFIAQGTANMAITILVFLLGVMGVLLYTRKKLPLWSLLGFLSYVGGSILFFAAPGNYLRAASIRGIPNIVHVDFLHRLLPFSVYFLYYAGLSLLLLGCTLLCFNKAKQELYFYQRLGLFVALAIFAAYALTTTPAIYYDPRVLFFSQILLAIAIAACLPEHNLGGVKVMLWYGLTVIVACSLVVDMVKTYRFYAYLHQEERARTLMVEEALRNNQLNLIVPPYYGVNPQNDMHIDSGRLYSEDISYDKTNWVNQAFSQAYGLESIATPHTPGIGAPSYRVSPRMINWADHIGIDLRPLNGPLGD